VKRNFLLLGFILFSWSAIFAQVKDSATVADSAAVAHVDSVKPRTTVTKIPVKVVVPDTARVPPDSMSATRPVPVLDSAWKKIVRSLGGKSFREFAFSHHPFFAFDAVPVVANSNIKRFEGKELLFYSLIGILLLFAFLKTIFAKYVYDLFRLFFRRTLKQRQITEQLSQTPLPSLVFNVFFIFTAGLYLAFVLQHYGMQLKENFWMLTVYCSAGLGAIYILKFLSLKFTGWVLNLSAATDSYIFIVFIINKVIGIFLLPFLVLLAFTDDGIYQVAVILSLCGIGCLFFYRFILTYSAVHNQLKVKPFHFLVYLVAFEIVPLLLIYKLLFRFLF
jgi:hypothetical protein